MTSRGGVDVCNNQVRKRVEIAAHLRAGDKVTVIGEQSRVYFFPRSIVVSPPRGPTSPSG